MLPLLLALLLSVALCFAVLRDAREIDFSGGRIVTSATSWVVLVAIFGVFALPGYVLAKRRAQGAEAPRRPRPGVPAIDPHAATSVPPPGWG